MYLSAIVILAILAYLFIQSYSATLSNLQKPVQAIQFFPGSYKGQKPSDKKSLYSFLIRVVLLQGCYGPDKSFIYIWITSPVQQLTGKVVGYYQIRQPRVFWWPQGERLQAGRFGIIGAVSLYPYRADLFFIFLLIIKGRGKKDRYNAPLKGCLSYLEYRAGPRLRLQLKNSYIVSLLFLSFFPPYNSISIAIS